MYYCKYITPYYRVVQKIAPSNFIGSSNIDRFPKSFYWHTQR